MEKTINISEVTKTDLNEIKIFFKATLTETFERHGIGKDELEEEIKEKISEVEEFLKGSRGDLDFIVAREEDRIIGIIKSSKTGRFSDKISGGRVKDIKEIGSLYILAEKRGSRVGSRLIEEILKRMKARGEKEFCFDCGFPDSQKRWIRKFGNPTITVKDYWGKGEHHMLWIKKIEED